MSHRIIIALVAVASACGSDTKGDSSADSATVPTTPTGTETTTDTTPTGTEPTDTVVTDTTPTTPVETTDVRILHVARGFGGIDMYLDGGGAPFLNDLLRLEGTPFRSRPTGTFDFQVVLTGDPVGAAIGELSGYAVTPGDRHTLIVYTPQAGDGLAILPVVDNVPQDPTKLALRWTHLALELDTVDLVDSCGVVLVDDLAFGGTQVVEYEPGRMQVGLDVDQDGVVDHWFGSFDFSSAPGAGEIVDVQILSGLDDPFLTAYKPDGFVVENDPGATAACPPIP